MSPRTFRRMGLPVLLIAMLLLSACAGAPTPAPAATEQPPAAEPTTAAGSEPTAATEAEPAEEPAATGDAVTIVHWQHHHEARAAIVEELAREFEAANPNVTVDFQSVPYNDYFQKIGPSLEAGTGPDVFQIPGPLVREFFARGQLSPVPEDVYASADIERDFVPWTVQLLKQEGQYVGLPTDVQPFLVFYNDDLFREAGLDPTKDLETFEEVTEAAVAMTKREGDLMTQAGIDLTASPYQLYWTLLTTLSDEGVVDEETLEVTYNSPEGIAMWEWLTGLVTEHGVDSAEFLTGQDKFALGLAGMDVHEYVYAGTLQQSAPDLNYSVHLPPHAPGRPRQTAGTHWAYVVSSQSEHPAEAWAWIKFLTSEDAQRRWIAGGGEVPSLLSLYEDEELRSDPVISTALDAMQVTVPFDDFGWDDVYSIQQAIWDNVVLNGQDVESAVQTAAEAERQLYEDKGLEPTQ